MLRAGTYRPHIENRIRADNTTLSRLTACPTASQHESQLVVSDRPSSLPLSSSARRSSASSLADGGLAHVRMATRPRRGVERSSMTTFRPWPTSIQICSVLSARPQRTPQRTGSRSLSTVAGAPRSIRSDCFMRRSRSTARKRKLRDGWPPRTRLLMCRGTRSTSGPPAPRRGCPNTAPSTGYARSTGTNPGTTNCAPKPSIDGCPSMYADPRHDPRMQQ